MNRRKFLFVLSGLVAAAVVSVAAGDVRVKVALLDGAPVYHWRAFKSHFSDDVDRALVLREFKRQGFTKVPDRFVEQRLQEIITKEFHSDRAAFEDMLKRTGASIAEFKQFVAEEMILVAFPVIAKREKVADSPAARAEWLVAQRSNVKLILLP